MDHATDNPLLATTGLPQFDRITCQHVVPAVKTTLARCEEIVAAVEQTAGPRWDDIFAPLDRLGQLLEHTWSPVGHLFAVQNSADLRGAYETALPEIVEFGLRARQSEPIYKALKGLRESAAWEDLDSAQQRIVEQRILGAELAGIGLTGDKRKRFNEIARELSQISTQFSNHVLDATKAFALVINDPADADGLPLSLRRLAAQSYNDSKDADAAAATADNGPWRITLDSPSFVPFMQHSRNRGLREEVYRAFVTRASSGEFDNTALCRSILALRKELAGLLGYNNYAEVSLAEKMATDAAAVLDMLERLRAASWDSAVQDLEDIRQLAKASGETEPLQHWDIAFWAERLREQQYSFTDEEVRPYFPHERVLEGLFNLLENLFGIRVVAANDDAPRWHKDVSYFKVYGEDGAQIAGLYYDPYSRPAEKRGGVDGRLPRPATYRWRAATARRPPLLQLYSPADGKPSLMTFREVETLFHEFGHGLQHILTTVDYPDAAGISGVEWDAVELPSQFMENWCYHRPVLMGMTAHFETGEPLPEELYQKLLAARTYRAGSNFLRQLTFGLTDILLHTEFDPNGDESIFDVQRRVMERTSVLPMFEADRFLCAFSHIFAGGYAAGYYSYKWAEVLSADAFSAFEEAGLDDEAAVRQTGRRFRDTVLSLGGSQHPLQVFAAFRGREPSPEALLRHNRLKS
ncbi:MAG: M3 family metallopeptidase [Planctomycetaceae bacterium]